MERTTKREVENVFERLCATVGVVAFIDHSGAGEDRTRPARYRKDADGTLHHNAGWSLDNTPEYGGWTICGHSGEGTGEDRPCGHERMPTRQFVAAMQFAIQAVYSAREAVAT